jgi:hypothetical protein
VESDVGAKMGHRSSYHVAARRKTERILGLTFENPCPPCDVPSSAVFSTGELGDVRAEAERKGDWRVHGGRRQAPVNCYVTANRKAERILELTSKTSRVLRFLRVLRAMSPSSAIFLTGDYHCN